MVVVKSGVNEVIICVVVCIGRECEEFFFFYGAAAAEIHEG